VVYALLDPGLGQMHICSAGHYPPLAASPGRPFGLAGVAAGLLIGAVPGAQRQVATLDITPGTLLCLYTDGLIERRGQAIDHGLGRLRQAVTAQPPDAACAAVMAAMVGWQASPR
jgi:serine phosphatase RsbU (regulator of sigma subunit)